MPIQNQQRSLQMRYAGGLIKHLGLSMYRGPVPVLAELIANAWDADASEVHVSIPFAESPSNKEIVIRDNGRGMTWDECENAYLVIGRNRRTEKDGDVTEGGRHVMGRKGIGKLAAFGIAKIVEVRTVRDGWLTHFRMNFDDMTWENDDPNFIRDYEPDVLADTVASEPNGTTIMLKELLLERSIPSSQFYESMSRRFSIISPQFRVFINDQMLAYSSMELQYEFEGPNNGTEFIQGLGDIRWKIGFTRRPIQVEDAKGVGVMVRGKLAQVPFFFDRVGGTRG